MPNRKHGTLRDDVARVALVQRMLTHSRMRVRRLIDCLCIALSIAGCGTSLPLAPALPAGDPSFAAADVPPPPGVPHDLAEPFMLMPGDSVDYRVVSTQTFEGRAVVDATGSIHLPIAGDVVVAAHTVTDAERAIAAALRTLDRFGDVTLQIHDAEGHRATVLGGVLHPGVVALRPGMRVAELFAAVGGPRVAEPVSGDDGVEDLADLDAARIIRNGRALPVSIPLALRGEAQHNVYVHPDDLLFVPTATGRRIAVLGTVRTPRMVRYHEGIRLTEALAVAGGTFSRSQERDIRVIRGPLSHPRVYVANLEALVDGNGHDVVLMPGDVVFVTPHWFFATTADVIQTLLPIFATAAITYGVVR